MNLTVNSVQSQVTPHFGASIVFSKTKEGQEAKRYYENSINSLSEDDAPVVEQLKKRYI
ncbi:hypothetical protein IJ596_02225 [bacterium]|nr:hypothetical protein [bacterium]